MAGWRTVPAALALAAWAAGGGAAWAQREPQAEGELPVDWRVANLFFGTQPYANDQGEFDVTPEVQYSDSPDSQETEVSLEVEYGVTDALLLSIGMPYAFLHPQGEGVETDSGEVLTGDENGIGDLEIAVLYSFTEATAPFVAAAQLGLSIPTGDEDRGLGEGVVEFDPALLFAAQFGPAAAYANIGMQVTNSDASVVYDLAGTYVLGPVSGILELYGTTDGQQSPVYLTPGLAIPIGSDVQFEVGVPVGLNDDAADWGITAMLAVSFDFD